jgi:glycosyltransferase involved in cell wall biosynthesis
MKAEGLKILFVTAHFPYPLSGGERIKEYKVLTHLSKKNKVTLLSFDKSLKATEKDINIIRESGIEPHLVKLNNAAAYVSAGFFSMLGGPMEVEFFRSKKFKESLDKLLNESQFDIIINFFLRTSDYVKELNYPKILMLEDCRSAYQRNTCRASRNLKEKAIRFYEYKKLRKFEKNLLDRFDVTTVVTEEDQQELKKLNPEASIEILTHGAEIKSLNAYSRENFLFLGKLDVWTNILMIKRLIKKIMPVIWKELPTVKLVIAGANPNKEVLNLRSDRVDIIANPEDIQDLYQKHAVFLHPHQGGSGIQNKALEAMSFECPIITTTSGSRGINIQNGINGFAADDDEEFAAHAIKVYKDHDLASRISLNAKKYVEEFHSWNDIMDKLDRLIVTCLSKNSSE